MSISKDISTNTNDTLICFINKKLKFYEDKIHELSRYYYFNKINNIINLSQYMECMKILQDISIHISSLDEFLNDKKINNLEEIHTKLSKLVLTYGIGLLEDFLNICVEFNFLNKIKNNTCLDNIELIKCYFHPLSLHVVNWNEQHFKEIPDVQKSIQENISGIQSLTFVNILMDKEDKQENFFLNIYGCYLIIQDEDKKQCYLIKGYWDNLNLQAYFKNKYINVRRDEFLDDFSDKEMKQQFWNILDIKSIFIYNNLELKSKFLELIQFIKLQSVRHFQNIIKDFLKYSLLEKRSFLINILVINLFTEQQYLAYLLYDLITKDVNDNIDSVEQTLLYDSFPYQTKIKFQEAMEKTILYNEHLNNNEKTQKISYENQIALMKCSDSIKEKGIQKMKEIKGKNDDSFLKAKHYLEGLLRVPFGIIKKEPILQIVDQIKIEFKIISENAHMTMNMHMNINHNVESFVDILTQVNIIEKTNKVKLAGILFETEIKKLSKKEITSLYKECNVLCLKKNININIPSDNSKVKLITYIRECINLCSNISDEISFFKHQIEPQYKLISQIKTQFERLPTYISSVKQNLDNCVHGHDEAKKQIERIIGQWISGDTSGYCFGFEGPPGVGKTTLAKKGIAQCLVDEIGDSRPFAMIQLGGDSNGSSLHGHNYTYVGSTWGNIVQILMDSKCMNPIIFIDEVDKVSKTENGREIIGILTHLLDVSQNDCFQDKYFAGINLDLSKALFILSYNDAELIDKILLDRIHRIKFNHLSLEEKIVICEKYILPEILQKMGLVDKVVIPIDLLRIIIEKYTNESGVRKLKELLFNIIGDINLDILNNGFINIPELPIVLTYDDVVNKFLKDRNSVKHKHVHSENKVGIINGLWANALGNGGIIPVQCSFYHCNQNLNLKLTGLQGDVMKESMNVALTLAWEKTTSQKQKDLLQTWTNNNKGIHIHCPEGAVPKDGPSAGAAITTAIYSLLNNVKIKHDIAMTGEISLDGSITEIGGLDLKILGGIRAGVKQFIFPRENIKDLNKFNDKYKDKTQDILFHPVSCLDEVFKIILDYE